MVHHLEQDVEQVGMGLLDFVEQQHAVRGLVDRVGQQAALIEADVARRRADQPRDGVALHVLAHVEAQELDAHHLGELARDLGLADAGRAGEQERANRTVGMREARARELDRARDRVDRGVLSVDHLLQLVLEILQARPIARGNRALRNLRHPRHRALGVARAHGHRVAPLARSCAATPASSITSIALSGR